MIKKFKKLMALFLSVMIIITLMPGGTLEGFAATPKDITITKFYYVNTEDAGVNSYKIVIEGANFVQNIGGANKDIPVIVVDDVTVGSGINPVSLMKDAAQAAGVKVDISNSLITITGPKDGEFNKLNIVAGGSNTITVNTNGDLDHNSYRFVADVGKLVTMDSLTTKTNYVGDKLTIKGDGMTDLTEVVIAGASHTKGKGDLKIDSETKITIDPLGFNKLNTLESVQFIKDNGGNVLFIDGQETSPKVKVPVRFSSEKKNSIIVLQKLLGMDNLQVLPNEGPNATPSKITVFALDVNDQRLENVFKPVHELYLRREVSGKVETLKLTDVKLVHKDPLDERTPVVGIEGWTPEGVRPVGSLWDLVVKDKDNPNAEGLKKNAFTFSGSNPAPQIETISPKEGPDSGGTPVLIRGKNIFRVNTPGIKIPTGFTIKPSGNAGVIDNSTLVVDYQTGPNDLTYGGKTIDAIQRQIRVRIGSMTNAVGGPIDLTDELPSTDSEFNGKPYGEFHYMSDSEDGLVVVTAPAFTDGKPQDVMMDINTTFTFKDGSKITIPEGARYSHFNYIELKPRPIIDSVDVEYGFFNESGEEEDFGESDNDGVKPLMMRIKGSKFEAYQDTQGNMHYPTVRFIFPDGTSAGMPLDAISSTAKLDTKVLDDKGNQIDGVYNKLGTTLVVSIIPNEIKQGSGSLRSFVATQTQGQGYNYVDAIIEVTNPSGNRNSATNDSVKFQFRRPDDEREEPNSTSVNGKQPVITQVIHNGAPVKRLPSDTESLVTIRVKAYSGTLGDLEQIRVTVDGQDISQNIKSAKFEGEVGVIEVEVPEGFVGKTRLQVIIPEGLMDTYTVTFDNAKGPEIKQLIPEEGDKGTIVVIKRDTQANEVGFKPPVDYDLPSASNEEKIGSKVLWNGIDINDIFNGYVKDSAGNMIPQESVYFTSFKQTVAGSVSEFIKTPGKYVYVVDSDTIYLKIPDDQPALKEGKYNIQIKNPDGAESSNPKVFSIVDVIDKTKIGEINPNTDDTTGGLIVTIKAGGNTNFKGGVDVYFGSQQAEVVGYDINNKEVYVKVPPLVDFKFPDTLEDKVESYTVPVTVQNKVNKSTDTKVDGFIYLNPNYKIEITQIYNDKYATDPNNAEANKGVDGDYVIVRGNNFRLETDKDGNYVLPKVMFGYTLADTPVAFGAKNVNADGTPITDAEGRAELEWVKVKVPKRPIIGIGQDGAVDILVQNPDGAKAIAEKGFIYKTSAPTINEDASVLMASRFHDVITVSAREINKDGLVVAFGEKIYEKELSSSKMSIETTKEVEKIVVEYDPLKQNNIAVYYKNPDGSRTLMTDAIGLIGGMGRIGAIGDSLLVGINWKNPAYHSTDIVKNSDLVNSLNPEYILISTQNKAPNLNTLTVRRGLGKVTGFVKDSTTNESKITIETPYNEKIEKTTITLINSDGSSATAPFRFHGGLEPPRIDDIDGSKDRDLTIEGKPVSAKVFTNDYTAESDITLIGANFKDIERIMVGGMDVQVLSISSDYTRVKIRVPKGTIEQVGVPMPVTMVTAGGNAYSDRSKPPVYYMFIQAGSKPELTDITPAKGPQTGGTKVIINGVGFRDLDEFGSKGDMEVFFSGKQGKVTRLLKNDKGEIVGLEAVTPAVDMIEQDSAVYVKNADEGKSDPLPFKYISQPVIEKIEGEFRLDAEKLEDSEDVKVTVIGKNFYNPEKVILGGKIIKVDKNKDALENEMMLGVKENGENQYVELEKNEAGVDKGIVVTAIEQKQPASNANNANKAVNPKNTTSFIMTMPIITFEEMQNMAGKNIIIVNPDGGTSPEAPADIKLPIPKAPVLIATPGYHGTIGLAWSYKTNDPNRATRFEVYAKKASEGDYVHIGDVAGSFDKTDYTYTIKDLEPDTQYQIKLRVMNKFGEAEDFGYAKVRTLRPEDDPKEKEKVTEMNRSQDNVRQNGTQKVVGDQLQYTVGTKENMIDLRKYSNKKKQVRIPVSQIKLAPNTVIQVIDKNMSMNVPFNAFYLNQVTKASDHAVVAIDITTSDNKLNTTVSRAIPRNKKRASEVYKVEFSVIEPKKKLPISFTNMPVGMSITPNGGGNATFAQYDEKTGKIVQNANTNIKKGGYYVLLKNK